ncbi:hypothetical protein [Thiocystis violacea]|uniref:hypothetical protein n=1 Tax=Thiocystis violacea TaxID=13725 RepID=UPI001903EEEA|nr:hypothetical protein [Thiocystis violacea]
MSASIEQAITEQLQAFARDRVGQMQVRPPKYDASGAQVIEGASLFGRDQIEAKRYVEARDILRQDILDMEAASPDRAPFRENDRAETLVDDLLHMSLAAMDSAGMTSARLPVSPWSDDYWAIYLGVLGCRYADPGFPASSDWKANYDYVAAHPPGAVLASGDADAIDRLSPAEKYDVLVGDASFTLTRQMWSEGRTYYDRYGEVESWMGICHGWAPAAYMLPRPTAPVAVAAADGRTLRFYPSDIKALASLLWANVRTGTRFIGGRCNDQDPATDPQTGRVTSNDCFDTNPGSWHLAVVNQIGASQRSLVLDATFDYQVWNQPMLAYEYRYFNPQEMRYASSLEAAQVAMADFTSDGFSAYRSGAAASVVGIAMDVSYIVETRPSHADTDSSASDGVNRVRYFYDIEQDALGGIIGGEWYSNAHPDFLWTPPEGERAVTAGDTQVAGIWRPGAPLPAAWQQAGRRAAAVNKAPLAAIVEQLIAFASG